MAKKLSKKQNRKNWQKGLKTKAIALDTTKSQMRKGIILT